MEGLGGATPEELYPKSGIEDPREAVINNLRHTRLQLRAALEQPGLPLSQKLEFKRTLEETEEKLTKLEKEEEQ